MIALTLQPFSQESRRLNLRPAALTEPVSLIGNLDPVAEPEARPPEFYTELKDHSRYLQLWSVTLDDLSFRQLTATLSPSRLFFSMGQDMVAGLTQGIAALGSSASAAVVTFHTGLQSFSITAEDLHKMQSAITGLADSIGYAVDSIGEFVQDIQEVKAPPPPRPRFKKADKVTAPRRPASTYRVNNPRTFTRTRK